MNARHAAWLRPFLSVVGVLVAYYAFPVGRNDSTAGAVLGLLLALAGLCLLGTVLAMEVQHLRSGTTGRPVGITAMILVLLVMTFSLVFFLLDRVAPDQVAGLSTRTDALYFTLSTMTTVGFGDVHAEGQIARALVCALIVFNIVVVASLVRIHTRLDHRDD